MKKTIKTYKNFEDFNENDKIKIYDDDGKENPTHYYNTFRPYSFSTYGKEFLLRKFQKNLLEVTSQAPRKKLTKEYLLDRKLSEFPLKLYNKTYECNIYNISIRNTDLDISIRSGSFTCNRSLDFLGELYLDPPSKELIEVVPPWAIEEPKKTIRVKIRKNLSALLHWVCYVRDCEHVTIFKNDIDSIEMMLPEDRIIEVYKNEDDGLYTWKYDSTYSIQIEYIMIESFLDSSSTWIVKFPKSLKEVSGDYSLEELRKLYPNCLYKKTTEGDWLE